MFAIFCSNFHMPFGRNNFGKIFPNFVNLGPAFINFAYDSPSAGISKNVVFLFCEHYYWFAVDNFTSSWVEFDTYFFVV